MLDFNTKTITENLEINEFKLDEELKSQPSMFFHYAALAAEADREVRRLKEAVEIVEAEADNRARTELTGKITEATVKAFIAQDEECISANQQYIDAVYQKNLLDAAVKAFDQRKGCLDNLVRLHTTKYFAEPEESIYAKAAEQDIKQEHVRKVVRRRLNKTEEADD